MTLLLTVLFAALPLVSLDERRALTQSETAQFASVGRIVSKLPGGAGSGALVAADLVLTAAHLFGHVRAPLTGYRFVLTSGLSCRLQDVYPINSVDVAVVRVDCPAKGHGWYDLDRPEVEAQVLQVGFHSDREGGRAKTIQRCVLRQRDVWVSSCESFEMASGSPVFSASGRIIGVVSGVGMPRDELGLPVWRGRYTVVEGVDDRVRALVERMAQPG